MDYMPPYDPTSDFYAHIAEVNAISKHWVNIDERMPAECGWYLVIFEEEDLKIYVGRCYWDGVWDVSCDDILFWIGEE